MLPTWTHLVFVPVFSVHDRYYTNIVYISRVQPTFIIRPILRVTRIALSAWLPSPLTLPGFCYLIMQLASFYIKANMLPPSSGSNFGHKNGGSRYFEMLESTRNARCLSSALLHCAVSRSNCSANGTRLANDEVVRTVKAAAVRCVEWRWISCRAGIQSPLSDRPVRILITLQTQPTLLSQ
jgi:hypothetical protein